MKIDPREINYKKLGFFRFRKLGNKFLLTNDIASSVTLKEKEFNDFITGKLDKENEPYLSLKDKGFIKDEGNDTDRAGIFRNKRSYLFFGPGLHIVIPTLRCNHRCVYCHASARDEKAMNADMDKKTADKVLGIIFKTTSPQVVIEFQGGEPLLNWTIVKYIIAAAKKINKKAKKDLEFRMVSNFSLMTEEKYEFLIKEKVSLCTSLDGPEALHKRNRPVIGGGNYGTQIKWIRKIHKDFPRLKKRGYIWKLSGMAVVSGFSLPYPKQIVDEYVKLGFSSIFFRPLNPFGFSAESWEEIKYTADEFISFYIEALEYIIKLNLAGKNIQERLAKLFLEKILNAKDPNMMELRSPCGASLGQLAYNYNGDVYTCDEGRMMSMMGDESYRIGNVFKNNYEELIAHPINRIICSASCLEASAGCSDCAYLPFCGTCPIYNNFAQGNIFGQMPTNERCRINKAILDHLFIKMGDEDVKKIFEKWV